MEEQAKQQQTGWQKVRRPLTVIGIIAACIGVVVLIFIVVRLYGTGFTGKTLWDWLGLLAALAIPAVVGFGVAWFTRMQQLRDQEHEKLQLARDQEAAKIQHARDQQLADQRVKTEREIAHDNQQEASLQGYIDRMSELLFQEKLRDSAEEGEVRKIARVRTLTTLRRLESDRKGILLQFLYDTGLINMDKPIVDLQPTLDWINLRSNVTLVANLSGANLRGADLHGAVLSGINLRGANLREANLELTNLSSADLRAANLGEAHLRNANLTEAKLREVDLHEADLSFADLSGAYLYEANLEGANLSDANLSRADLTGATGITIEELRKQAKSLAGAIMPDSSKHP